VTALDADDDSEAISRPGLVSPLRYGAQGGRAVRAQSSVRRSGGGGKRSRGSQRLCPAKASNYRFATSSSPHPQSRSHRPTCAILGRRTNEILTVIDIVADLPVPGSQVHLRQLARRCRFRTGRRELIELATTFEYRADRFRPRLARAAMIGDTPEWALWTIVGPLALSALKR
jgi:hypothetical protein